MDIALAVVTIATAVAVGVVSVFLLTRLVRTIVELRRITVGLNDVLGWAVGRVLHDRGQRGRGADDERGGARVDGDRRDDAG